MRKYHLKNNGFDLRGNKMRQQIIFLAIICVTVCSAAFTQTPQADKQGVGLTIYNNNFAVVRESRQIEFDQGINTVKFTDVASAIDPTSVNFKCLSAPGTISILEQNYEYDLINTDSLLNRYIDKVISVSLKGSGADSGKSYGGVLSAAKDNNIILRQENGIRIISRNDIEEISLKQLPKDLVTKPTLLWLADANQSGPQLCLLTYTTEKLGWKADYSAVLNGSETKLDFSGWVTIDNKSGAAYRDAVIKLIAGDVRRVVEQPIRRGKMMAMEAAAAFEEKAFGEYHLYTLSRKSTINNNQVKQIEFIAPALGVNVNKIYIYNRGEQPDKVQVKLEFENSKHNKLGIALPKGKIRVFKKDPADGMLEFAGEDRIDHTPRNETLLLYIGNAFDITAEHTLVDSKPARRQIIETHRIELGNRKRKAVMVFVDEKFGENVNWTIDKTSHKYEKRDANTARFTVKIAPNSTATVEYTTTQKW